MGRRFFGLGRLGLPGALILALAGCGGDSPAPPLVVVTPQPPEPVRGVIAHPEPIQNFEPDVWLSIPIMLTQQKGILDITVDWTFSDSWMYVYFGRTDCDYSQLAQRKCPFMIASEAKTPKPRVLYTEKLELGTYYLYLYNAPRDPRTGKGSDNTESVMYQLGLTVTASGQRAPDAFQLGRPFVVAPPEL
jgi:hypothetical protein